jgi:lipopolysaccharide export system protein LptA
MRSSFRDKRRRILLAMLMGGATLTCMLPGLAARAPAASIQVHNKGQAQMDFNAGTQLLEQDVTIRQAPDTFIRADKAEGSNMTDGNFDNGHWVLSGKVHIEFEGTVLDANSATVIFEDSRIQSIVVQGTPARFSHPTGTTGERNQGQANTITYDGNRRQIRFAGQTAYAFGPYEGSSDKPLTYSLDTTGITSEKGGSDDSRIIFTFRNMQASARFWRANISDGTQVLEQDVELRRTPGTLIRAEKAEGSNLTDGYDEGQWTLTRRVQIEYEDAALDADTAAVAFGAGEVRSIQVRGTPARFSYPAGNSGQRFEGRADTISFDAEKRQVRVAGHPSRYTFGIDQGSSDKPLLYELDKGAFRSEDTGDADARVRGTFNPGNRVPTPRTPDRGTAQ